MRIRVVEYFSPDDGITRFTFEMIRALIQKENIRVDFLTYGAACQAYQRLLEKEGLHIEVLDAPPSNVRSLGGPKRVLGIKGTARLKRLLGLESDYFCVVPGPALDDCDMVWFPMAHRHLVVDEAYSKKVVGTLHDLTVSEFEEEMKVDDLPEEAIRQEEDSVRGWLSSDAQLVTDSDVIQQAIGEKYGVEEDRLKVVPILARHVPPARELKLPSDWTWAQQPFLMYPARFLPHKNHEMLIRALGQLRTKLPLVLTGAHSDLPTSHPRALRLRRLAESEGLQIGSSLIPLGHIADEEYYALLNRAHALVFPTLAEGQGLPVLEAMLYGIPVLCSDIPIMREQMRRTGGEVLWFDPRSVPDLVEQLQRLEDDYPHYKQQAEEQVKTMSVRNWSDVANDYLSIMSGALRSEGVPPCTEGKIDQRV